MEDQVTVPSAGNRVDVIQTSLKAFVLGIIGFLPVIGLVPAVLTLRCDWRIRSRYAAEWNPAANYLKLGVILALIGLLGTTLILFSALATIAVYSI